MKVLMINKFLYPNGGSETYIFKLSENVIFTGFVSGRKRKELYNNVYVYVLQFELGEMPLSLPVAMSYGNCRVVSDISERAEVVEDKTVVFRKSDVGDLSEKLQGLMDDDAAVKKYKDGAADFICTKYSWDNV